MTNNYEIIKPFLDFSDPDGFYTVVIISRIKDNPEQKYFSQINVKTYVITTLEDLERQLGEMETLCQVFNARAWIYLNRRSFKKTKESMTRCLTENVKHKIEDPFDLRGLFLWSAEFEGHYGTDTKWWFVDIDPLPDKTVTTDDLSDSVTALKDVIISMGGGDFTVVPSKTGCHLISKPFDYDSWKRMRSKEIRNLGSSYGVGFTLKKDAMLNLIVP